MTATIPRRRRNVWAGHNIDAATAAHTSEGEAASARMKRENAPLAAKQAADLARDFRDRRALQNPRQQPFFFVVVGATFCCRPQRSGRL